MISQDQRYKVSAWGGCLGDWMPDDIELLVNPTADLNPFDLCSIIFRDDEDLPWARFMRPAREVGVCGACKIFLGRQADVVLLGQISPPVLAPVPIDHIEALHRVVGTIGGQRNMSDRDTADLGLIAGAAKGWEGCPPINPDWQPEEIGRRPA